MDTDGPYSPQRQRLYKYYLRTPTCHKTLAATALQRDPKYYTYKYDDAFIEQHSALIEDVGLLEVKNTISIPKWLERVLMFVFPYPPGNYKFKPFNTCFTKMLFSDKLLFR